MPLIAVDRFIRGGSGTGPFAVIWEDDAKLSYITVADVATRDLLPEWKRLPYMRVHCIAEATDYRLGANITIAGQVWTAVNAGISPGTYQVLSEKNQANGYVGLNGATKIDPIYIDNIYTNSSYVVADNAARNATTTLTGDIVVVTGTSKIFVKLNNNVTPNVDADYAELLFPGVVTSVNGQVGAVSITISNLLAVPANQTAFEAAVAATPAFTSLSSQVSINTGDIATFNGNLVALEMYADTHLNTKLLPAPPTVAEDGQALRWDNTTDEWVYFTPAVLSLTNGSGTTANGFSIDLGGTLAADVIISGAFNFLIGDGGGHPPIFQVVADTAAISTFGSLTFIGTTGVSIVTGFGAELVLSDPGSANTTVALGVPGAARLHFTEVSGHTFRDFRATPEGLKYFSDYSSTFVTLSLIHKGYADSHLLGLALPATPGAGEDGQSLVYDHGTGEWIFAAGGGVTQQQLQEAIAELYARLTGTAI